MFKIQKTLDKSESYGHILGITHNGALYAQNGLEFSHDGKRVTPYTPEEEEAVEAYAALQEKRDAADAKGKKAAESTAEAATAEADEAEANTPVKEIDPDMPDFDSGWTKPMLLTHALDKFQVTLDPAAHHRTLVAQVKALYN